MSDRDLERGPKGDHGQHGDTGDIGRRGDSGHMGERGQHGLAGLPGVTGERGPTGDMGNRGIQGVQGDAGRDWQFSGASIVRLLAYALVVIAAAFATYRIDQNGIHNLEKAELRTCARVQYLRDQANGTNFLIYDTFKQVVDQQQTVIDSGRLQGAALKQAQQAVRRSKRVVDTTVVTGPTDCQQATFNNNYKAPAPEFIARNSPRVKAARIHAAEIIKKARLHQPLYDATHQPHPNP